MVKESTESKKNEVESVVNEAVYKIYSEGHKVLDSFNWAVEQIKDQRGEGYHALAVLDDMYPKLAPREQKLLAMRIPCSDPMDW
jgi:ribosomal protein S7